MSEMITPPVSPEALAEAETALRDVGNVKADLTLAQRLIKADKSAVVAAVVHLAVLLVAAFGLHLSGGDVGVIGSIVTLGLSWFVSLNLSK